MSGCGAASWRTSSTPSPSACARPAPTRASRRCRPSAATPVLKPAQIDDLTEYVVHLSHRAADARAVRRATLLFADNCAACHGPEGKGNRSMGAPNLTDNDWLYADARRYPRPDLERPWRRDADLGRPADAGGPSRRWPSMSTIWAAAGVAGAGAPLTAHRHRPDSKRPEMAAEGVARSDAAATNSAANRKLYKSRVPIYPKLVHGPCRTHQVGDDGRHPRHLLSGALAALGSRPGAPQPGGAGRSGA